MTAEVLSFPRSKARVHCSGFLVNRLGRLAACDPNGIEIDEHQQNAMFGVHQARMKLQGDDTVYRLILAPADAPVMINGVPADEHFSHPLEIGS